MNVAQTLKYMYIYIYIERLQCHDDLPPKSNNKKGGEKRRNKEIKKIKAIPVIKDTYTAKTLSAGPRLENGYCVLQVFSFG